MSQPGFHGKGFKCSGDSWMYPYKRTRIGNPFISPI